MKYTKELLQEAVSNTTTIKGVLDYFGLKMAGGTHSHIKKRIEHFKIDTTHFVGKASNKGRVFQHQRKSIEDVFILREEGSYKEKTYILVRTMIEDGFDYKCTKCGNKGEWNNKKLVLQVDHIDGNSLNNIRENLRFLCPNCHSQTKTFCRPKPD